jgi:hypothetical protein
MTEAPFITTGTVIVFGPEPSEGDGGATLDRGNEGSAGRDLKNFSSFLDSSVSPCHIHPTIPLALTKYHLAPSPTKVSAKGEISSPGFRVAITAEESSGAVNSFVSPPVGRGRWTVAACECLQTAKSTKAAEIRAALSFVKSPPQNAFNRPSKLNAIRAAQYQLEKERTFRFSCKVCASICRALPRPSPCCRWFDAAPPR